MDTISELPMLEAHLWESATDAVLEAEPFDWQAAVLGEFGYELGLVGGLLTLRHMSTGQVMQRRVE